VGGMFQSRYSLKRTAAVSNIVHKSFVDRLVEDNRVKYNENELFSALIRLSGDFEYDLETVENMSGNTSITNKVWITSSILSSSISISYWRNGIVPIFLYGSLILGIFAPLLILNFVTASIASSKRTIGVLRALGAKGRSVFQIFYIESLMAGLVNFLLASVASVIATTVLNSLLSPYFFTMDIVTIGLLLAIIVVPISLFVTAPIIKFAKQSPIKIIRGSQ